MLKSHQKSLHDFKKPNTDKNSGYFSYLYQSQVLSLFTYLRFTGMQNRIRHQSILHADTFTKEPRE